MQRYASFHARYRVAIPPLAVALAGFSLVMKARHCREATTGSQFVTAPKFGSGPSDFTLRWTPCHCCLSHLNELICSSQTFTDKNCDLPSHMTMAGAFRATALKVTAVVYHEAKLGVLSYHETPERYQAGRQPGRCMPPDMANLNFPFPLSPRKWPLFASMQPSHIFAVNPQPCYTGFQLRNMWPH